MCRNSNVWEQQLQIKTAFTKKLERGLIPGTNAAVQFRTLDLPVC
jgi:hypothetical protein